VTDSGGADVVSVQVPVGDRSYPVLVGHGAVAGLRSLLPATARQVAVITQSGIPLSIDSHLDLPITTLHVGHGEQHKTLATVEALCNRLAEIGLSRNDVIVGVGGGMVTDIAGFAAATWHRGVPVVHVATSLLAMVDAAIGGKTGVNLAAGKNLVGAFWQPQGVVCDLDALATLPERELRCGMGEMAKYHFLTGDDLLAMSWTDRVARCVQIKADVVAGDEREDPTNRRGRAILNYGHTLAHALETATGHQVAHGEAVAIGLIYAAHVAHTMERIGDDRVRDHYRVVGEGYGLGTTLPEGVDHDELVTLMRRDKKVVDGGLTFVLDGADGVETVPGVSESTVRAALAAMG
jgi:5-deoxy-5-amino-3-dehydroquinate synthase